MRSGGLEPHLGFTHVIGTLTITRKLLPKPCPAECGGAVMSFIWLWREGGQWANLARRAHRPGHGVVVVFSPLHSKYL
jgi:hypothetical protein